MAQAAEVVRAVEAALVVVGAPLGAALQGLAAVAWEAVVTLEYPWRCPLEAAQRKLVPGKLAQDTPTPSKLHRRERLTHMQSVCHSSPPSGGLSLLIEPGGVKNTCLVGNLQTTVGHAQSMSETLACHMWTWPPTCCSCLCRQPFPLVSPGTMAAHHPCSPPKAMTLVQV